MKRRAAWAVGLAAWLALGLAYVREVRDRAHEAGYRQAMAEAEAVGRAAQLAADEDHRRQIEKVKEAQHEREKQAAKLAADNGRLRADLDGLRQQIAGARGDFLPGAGGDTAGGSCAALQVLGKFVPVIAAAVVLVNAGVFPVAYQGLDFDVACLHSLSRFGWVWPNTSCSGLAALAADGGVLLQKPAQLSSTAF